MHKATPTPIAKEFQLPQDRWRSVVQLVRQLKTQSGKELLCFLNEVETKAPSLMRRLPVPGARQCPTAQHLHHIAHPKPVVPAWRPLKMRVHITPSTTQWPIPARDNANAYDRGHGHVCECARVQRLM